MKAIVEVLLWFSFAPKWGWQLRWCSVEEKKLIHFPTEPPQIWAIEHDLCFTWYWSAFETKIWLWLEQVLQKFPIDQLSNITLVDYYSSLNKREDREVLVSTFTKILRRMCDWVHSPCSGTLGGKCKSIFMIIAWGTLAECWRKV